MNNNFLYCKKTTRTCAIGIFTMALVLILFSCAFLPVDVAYSVSPDGYVDYVVNNEHDWYMAENCLNLAMVKRIVNSWKESSDYDFDGIKPVVVAVIDSGINYNHEIFTGKYDENGVKTEGDGIGKYDVLLRDNDGEIIKYAYVDGKESQDIADVASNKHGTHVAGIVATFIHELGLEDYIKILPIRAGSWASKGATFKKDDLKQCVLKALEYGADVVNMSISGTEGSSTGYNIVSEDMAQKAVFVAAAGNKSSSLAAYPAAGENCIGVMNYTIDDYGNKTLSTNSNFGKYYDLCAPGTKFYSADGDSKTNDGYKSLDGTSMASPVVAFGAAVAMLKDRAYCNANKGITPKSPIQIKEDILSTATLRSVKTVSILDSNAKYNEFNLVNLLLDEPLVKTIEAEDCGDFNQTIDDVKLVKLNASINENLPDDGTIEWYIQGNSGELTTKIGEGATLEYLPSAVGEEYVVFVYTYQGASGEQMQEVSRACRIKVDYLSLTSLQIRGLQVCAKDADGNDVTQFKKDIEYEFSIKDLNVDALNPQNNICWYINNELVAEGKTFKYTFLDDADKSVCVRINNQFSKALEINFEDEQAPSINVLEMVSIAGGAGVIVALVVVFIVFGVKKKKQNIKD